MEERRFDQLTAGLARGNSRRSLLKGFLAGAAGGLGLLVDRGSTLAAPGGGGGGSKSTKPDCCPSTAPRLCGTQCVDLQSNAGNCGSCGNACPSGAVCQNGACVCPSGTTACNGACVTLNTTQNCGACGNACPGCSTCNNGTCQAINCDDGNPCTIDSCDPSTGACVHAPAPAGTVCGSAICTGSTFTGAPTCNGAGICQSGTTVNCSPYTCDATGVACRTTCSVNADCAAGYQCQNGACVAVAPSGCTPGATQSCYSGPAGTAGVGACQYGVQTCQADGTWGACQGEVTPQPEICNGIDDNCNGIIDDGFDLAHDVNNCGNCGHVCRVPNGTPACMNGICVIAACNPGFGDCNGNYADGCETNLLSDSRNCGGCGIVCASGTTCQNGTCV